MRRASTGLEHGVEPIDVESSPVGAAQRAGLFDCLRSRVEDGRRPHLTGRWPATPVPFPRTATKRWPGSWTAAACTGRRDMREIGRTCFMYSASAVAPLKQMRWICRCSARKVAKSFGTAEAVDRGIQAARTDAGLQHIPDRACRYDWTSNASRVGERGIEPEDPANDPPEQIADGARRSRSDTVRASCRGSAPRRPLAIGGKL